MRTEAKTGLSSKCTKITSTRLLILLCSALTNGTNLYTRLEPAGACPRHHLPGLLWGWTHAALPLPRSKLPCPLVPTSHCWSPGLQFLSNRNWNPVSVNSDKVNVAWFHPSCYCCTGQTCPLSCACKTLKNNTTIL